MAALKTPSVLVDVPSVVATQLNYPTQANTGLERATGPI